MTMNNRPIADPRLQRALNEIKAVMGRHGLAGACMLVSESESAFVYVLHAPWSAFRPDPTTPLGYRFRVLTAEAGPDLARKLVEGAGHTICQLADFGEQTIGWMEDLRAMLQRAGITFEHISFGGQELPHITNQRPDAH